MPRISLCTQKSHNKNLQNDYKGIARGVERKLGNQIKSFKDERITTQNDSDGGCKMRTERGSRRSLLEMESVAKEHLIGTVLERMGEENFETKMKHRQLLQRALLL